MKYILILSMLAALVGGCAVGPPGYGDRERNFNGDGSYRGHDFNDGNYHKYSYRGDRGDAQPKTELG